MKHLRLFWIATGAVLLLYPGRAPAESARGTKLFFWKAVSPTTEVYLMGSVHMGKPDFYPLAAEIEKAFERSKYLVLEADESKADMAKIQQTVLSRGMYPDGDSLAAHVPADLMKGVAALSETLGIPMPALERMKPWFLSLSASILAIQKLGYSPDLGIDRHFMGEAKEKGKEILELESMDFQIDLLSGFSDDQQVKFLASTVDEVGKSKEKMDAMMEAWSRGDDQAMERETITQPLAKHPEFAPVHEKLIDSRNVGMVKKIEGYLKSSEVHFVVVGAAHLVGERGIVRLLEKDGFKVEHVEKP